MTSKMPSPQHPVIAKTSHIEGATSTPKAPEHICSLAFDVLNAPRRTPGKLPLGNYRDPLDELLFIICTTMTQYGTSDTFRDLRKQFSPWTLLLRRDAQRIATTSLKKIGLSSQKASYMVGIAKRLNRDFGTVSLSTLVRWDTARAEAYLLELPGVGKKVARCVLMYSLNRDVLPVDTHVFRVSKRLGLIAAELPYGYAQDAIQLAVPAGLRYGLHVAMVRHGRSQCSETSPECSKCPLLELNICAGVYNSH